MAQDRSYQTENYDAQGGKLSVIGSSGVQEVYGKVDVKAGGYVVEAPVSETPNATLAAYGVSIIACTSGNNTFTLTAPPAAGVRKVILFTTQVDSSDIGYVYTSTGSVINSTDQCIRCVDSTGFCELISRTTARWIVLNKTTGVTFNSTGST